MAISSEQYIIMGILLLAVSMRLWFSRKFIKEQVKMLYAMLEMRMYDRPR